MGGDDEGKAALVERDTKVAELEGEAVRTAERLRAAMDEL